MEPSAELSDVIRSWFTAAVDGDVSWRDRHVSKQNGLRIVGTDPDEWLTADAAYAFLHDEAANIGGRATVEVPGWRRSSTAASVGAWPARLLPSATPCR